MIKITKPLLQKALIAGFFSAFTIGVLTVLTYKSTLGYFIAASFGSSMVLLYGYPESPFAQPKNVFFGHLVTALVGVIFVNYIPLPIYISIAIAVGAGVFLMILFNIVHPPAGGNPIIVIIGSASYDYLINPIIFGCIIILLLPDLLQLYDTDYSPPSGFGYLSSVFIVFHLTILIRQNLQSWSVFIHIRVRSNVISASLYKA